MNVFFSANMPKQGSKRGLSAKSKAAVQSKIARCNEGSERRENRLESMRKYEAEKRQNETPDERSDRLESKKQRTAYVRSTETIDQKAQRLSRKREYDAKKLRDAVQNEKKLGCLKDSKLFDESEFPDDVKRHDIRSLYDGDICSHCSAFKWKDERPGFCCEKGKITLPPLKLHPTEIKELYQKRDFLDKIRSYNNALALASIGCDEKFVPGFNPTFKIQGKVFHRIGSLKPGEGEVPKFAQLYFYDSDNEVANRLHHNQHLQGDILSRLQDCLKSVNPYIESLQYATHLCEENPELQVVIHADKKPKHEHSRKYNLPTGSEIAVIMPGEQEGPLDVVLQNKEGKLQTINSLHRSYDPLHYVLLFPGGDDGYTESIKKENGKNMSPVEFYKYRLQVRNNDDNTLMKSRRLTQQYATDAYAKVEGQRLRWVRSHQREIRADKYKGLLDAVDANDGVNAGQKVILPPSVTASPRWYAEEFQDSMALVRKYGKPDIFATFTANPQWDEIKSSLLPGESPHDRSDICDRVFKIKHTALLKDLLEHEVLGKVKAFTSMIEFQKRGLPHAHILLIMDDKDKPRTPEAIDKIVSAEIPDISVNPNLHAIVTKNMVHGPCGPVNPTCPCMETTADGKKCSKDYPKEFKEETSINANGYPFYRRRSPENGGRTYNTCVKGQEFTIDNRWIVPYNPFLSLKYKAHLNVEVVTSVQCVKYLYKYITKGSDRVIIQLANGEKKDISNDEVERFVNARYISASQAYWRLYEFRISERYPPVEKLPLHLENEQTVYFQPEQASEIASKPPPITKLTAYFDLNKESSEARNILYPDIFQYFTWKNNQWVKRRNRMSKLDRDGDAFSDVIGRIPVVGLNAHQTELYYMRMLLYNKAGAKSFADLRTIDGVELPSFQDACKKMGLLDDDNENDRAMEEAASIRFGPQLRQTFAMILVWNRPIEPKEFWDRHKNILCEDLLRREHVDVPSDEIINEVLLDIEEHLQRNGLKLETFQLPKPDRNLLVKKVPRELREETEYDIKMLEEIVQKNVPLLNKDQLNVYNAILDSVNNGKGEMIALDAAGGSGKTFLTTTALAKIRSEGKVALATATSGIAATLLPNGRTLHSRCKVPVEGLNENSFCNVTKRDATAELIRRAVFLVVDEVTMAKKEVYEAVNRTFQDIRGNDLPFGGVTVLFSGDWRQILPVVRHGGRADIIEACLKRSPIWKQVKIMKLTKNMRLNDQDADAESFAEQLLEIGEGRAQIEADLGEYKIKVDDAFLLTQDSVQSLCNFVWNDLHINYTDPEWLCSRAVLCPTNEASDEINEHMTICFPGEERSYHSSDSLIDGNNTQYPEEFLNTLCSSGMPPHKLTLKEKCPIMLLRNLDPCKGHCNGTRYVVTGMYDHVIDATVATGVHVGQSIMIPRIPTCPTESIFPFKMQRRQFPLRRCFAMTANKAQGQGLRKIGIYLKKQFFSHGQLYVAMSRVSAKRNLKILTKDGRFPGKDGVYIDNVVYPEILTS